MKFNPCNPCCTSLPAWTVYHAEVSKKLHVLYTNSSFVLPPTETSIENRCDYYGHLFYARDSGTYWIFENCPAVEGDIQVQAIFKPTQLEATGRCAEQTWIKAGYIQEFSYSDSQSHYTHRFNDGGEYVRLSCHLVDMTGGNYLNLQGSLSPVEGWKIKSSGIDESPNPQISFWTTPYIAPRVGAPDSKKPSQCFAPDNTLQQGYYDAPVGEFSFGLAKSGTYYLADFEPLEQTGVVTNGSYIYRWSPYLYGMACTYYGGSASVPSGTGCPPSIQTSYNSAWASIQAYPLFLDLACAFTFYDNQFTATHFPYLFWNSRLSLIDSNYWNDGQWAYMWWYQYCTYKNSGPYVANYYNWWWGGPYYNGYSLLNPYPWNWWGRYPCITFGHTFGSGLCWWWGWGYLGWWDYWGWWWWGGPFAGHPYLGEYISPSWDEFDAWYESIPNVNGFCSAYSRCVRTDTLLTELDCGIRGARPITITMKKVKIGNQTGKLTMRGTPTWTGTGSISKFYPVTDRSTCTPGVQFKGSFSVTGLVTGTVDVTFTNELDFLNAPLTFNEGGSKLTFFGAGVMKDEHGNNVQVSLNGEYLNNFATHANSFVGQFSYNASWGNLRSGDCTIDVVANDGDYVQIGNTGFDFSNVRWVSIDSTLEGDVYRASYAGQLRQVQCHGSVDCIPRKPVIGQASLMHHDVSYTFIYNPDCFLIDIVANIGEYCYGLAVYDTTIDRHCQSELLGEHFVRLSKPPMYYNSEMPITDCGGDVTLSQQAVLISDLCFEVDDE